MRNEWIDELDTTVEEIEQEEHEIVTPQLIKDIQQLKESEKPIRQKMQTPYGQWVPVKILAKITLPGPYKPYRVPALDESGIQFLAQCIKDQVDAGKNCNILLTGEPGVGKSTLMAHLVRTIDPAFSIDNIAFTLEDFDRIYSENPAGGDGVYPQVVMDEAAHSIYSLDFMNREQKLIVKNLTTTRIKRQIVYFCAPAMRYVNAHVRLFIHYWIHLWQPRVDLQGFARVRDAPPQLQSEFQRDRLWIPRFTLLFPQISDEWWEQYEQKKLEFVSKALSDGVSVLSEKYENRLREAIEKLHSAGWTYQQIADLFG